MCNLYSQTRAWHDHAGNLEPGHIYPDRLAPIIRNAAQEGVELAKARWEMPTPPPAPHDATRSWRDHRLASPVADLATASGGISDRS